LKLQTQIRIADWIDFAIMLPLMFGISFQLPLVMLFLERLSIFEVKDYQEKRRIAIFVITVISMVLTPAEPYSMLMMMFPMIVLYEFGILICRWFPKPKAFDDEEGDEKKTTVATT
jgi:sec-independent protein translocase protein TatC